MVTSMYESWKNYIQMFEEFVFNLQLSQQPGLINIEAKFY
jgi:hypothetical protein